MCIEAWGPPEAMRLRWVAQRAVSILFYNLDNTNQEELVAGTIAIAWGHQKNPLSLHFVRLCAVKAFIKLFEGGRLLDELQLDCLTDIAVEQPELTDMPDNVVLLADWREQKMSTTK